MATRSNILTLLSCVTLVAAPLLSCSGPLLSGGSGKKTFDAGISEGVEAGKDTTLSVQTGSLAGTLVTFPGGSLPPGSEVNVQNANTPPEFQNLDGVEAASNALTINAVSSDGSPIYELPQAMTIQLPVAATALTLTTDSERTRRLCAFLRTPQGGLFVWRRQAMRLKDGKVLFESNRTGTYQLMLCGEQPLANFEDAADSEIAGSASQTIATFIIPETDSIPAAQYCVGLAGNLDEDINPIDGDDPHFYGYRKAKRNSSGDTVINVRQLPGSGLTSRKREELVYLFFFFQPEGANCDFGEDDEDISHSLLMAFRREIGMVQDGVVQITLGEDGFTYERKPVKLGSPGGGAVAGASFAAEGCLHLVTPGKNEGGLVEHNITTATQNRINGVQNFETYVVPTGSTAKSKLVASFNAGCDDDLDLSKVDDSTDQAIKLRIEDFYNQTTDLYLAPTALKFEPGAVGIPGAERICVRVFDNSVGDPINLSETEQRKHLMAQFFVRTTGSNEYPIYLPHRNTYRMFYRALAEDANCLSEGITQYSDDAANLNPVIDITVPGQ